jgi:hypothetical protein
MMENDLTDDIISFAMSQYQKQKEREERTSNVANPMDTKMDTDEMKSLLRKYITSLDDSERNGLHIAYDHLNSSFNLIKSIGFTKWRDAQQQ